MAPQKKKFNIEPSASTTQQIYLLSTEIDDSSTLPRSKNIVTPDKMTPKKRIKQISGKSPRLILEEHILITDNLIHNGNNLIYKMKYQIQIFQRSPRKTQ